MPSTSTADSTVPDETIVANHQMGDTAAFAELVRRYTPAILGIATRYHYIADNSQEDLAQECLMALHRAVNSFDSSRGASFRTFANRVIENRMIDLLRKHGPKEYPVSFDEQSASFAAEQGLSPADYYEQQEGQAQYYKQLKKHLSPFEYQVLLCYIQNHSYQAVAKRLAVNEKSVDNALQRVRRKIMRNTYLL